MLALLLAIFSAIEADNGDIVKLFEFLLNKLHDVAIDLVLKRARLLQALRRPLDVLVNLAVEHVARFLNVLQWLVVNGKLLGKTRLVTDHEIWAFVKGLDVED